MSFAVLRIEKLKSHAAIKASERHIQREMDTPNADLSQSHRNQTLIGDSSISLNSEVERVISDLEIKPRSNAVLCLEVMLSVGQDFWQQSSDEMIQTWAEYNKRFLQRQYGDHCIRATLHLDELSPHIHAHVVPITLDNRLSAREVMGSRLALSVLQSQYAKAMSPLGIRRGIRKSKADHTEVQEFYGAIQKDFTQGLSQDEIRYQLAHRDLLLRQNKDLLKTCEQLSRSEGNLETQLKDVTTQLDEMVSAVKSMGLQEQIYGRIFDTRNQKGIHQKGSKLQKSTKR